MSHYDKKEKRTLFVYIFIFFLIAMGIAISGYLSYRNFQQQFRDQNEYQLSAIAELKTRELVNWRIERMVDAELLYNNLAFSTLVERYFENPADVETRSQLIEWLDHYQTFDQYDKLHLLDVTGTERFSFPLTTDPLESHLTQQAIDCLNLGKVTFLDFYRDTSPSGVIRLAILVPIFTERNDNRPLGVLVLSIDPNVYLYPYIQSWPIDSTSAETLLVRRDGENVLFLNELRFGQDAALTLRLPLTSSDTPAVKAALGQTGVVEGLDYRGEPVLADVRAVPDSPWFLVSKMDTSEAHAPLRQRLWQTFGIIGMAIIAAGAGLALAWRQQRILFYRAQAEVTEALRASEEKFRKAFMLSPDSININRLQDGMYVSINNGFTKIMGYIADEVVGKTSLELNIWVDPLERKALVDGLKKNGEVANLDTRFRAKNGDIKNGLMSASLLELNGIPHIISITRDITERKQAEENLERFFSINLDLLCVADMDGNFIKVNKAWESILGYPASELESRKFLEFVHPEDMDSTIAVMSALGKQEQVLNFVNRYRCMDGSYRFVEWNSQPYGNFVYAAARDITERKQAEDALRESEDKFKYVFDYSVVGKSITHLDGEVHVNKALCDMLGYSPEEMQDKKWQEITHPDDIELTQNTIDSLISGEKGSARFVKRFIHKNGTIIWVDLSSTLRRDQQNNPLYLMSAVMDITERKRAEEALEKRIIALTLPLENAESITFNDLFNLGDIQRIQDEFAKATGVASIITHVDGTPITAPSNFCRLCNDIIRKTPKGYVNCCKSDAALGQLNPKGATIQPCMSGGLWDAGAGISVGGKHIANWLIGQIRDETQTEEKMLEYARNIGANEQAILKAFHEVPSMSREKFEDIAKILFTLANQLSTMAYQNIQQARFIAERKQAEETLIERNKFISTLVETIPALVYVYDMEMNSNVYSNSGIQQIFGYTAKQVKEMGTELFTKLVHPDDLTAVIAVQSKIANAADGAVLQLEYRMKTIDERWLNIRSYESPFLRNRDGSLKQKIGVAIDITERKQTEEALKLRESYLTAIIENEPGLVWLKDIEGRFLAVNSAFALSCGKQRPEEVAGRTDLDIWSQELAEKYRADDVEIISRKIPVHVEELIVDQGQAKWFETFKTPIFDGAGRVIGTNGFARDITERKQTEDSLRRYTSMLEEAEKNANLGSWAFDPAIGKGWWSKQMYRMFGYDISSNVPSFEEYLNHIHPEDRPLIQDVLLKMTQGEEPKIHGYRSNPEYGPVRYFLPTQVMKRDADGKPLQIIGTLLDITERKLVEDSSRKSEALYRKMNENSPLGMHFYKLNNNELIFWGSNPAADKLLGVDHSQFIGKTIEEAFPPLTQTEVPGRYRDAAAKGIPWSTEQIAYEDRQITGAFEVRAFQTTAGNMVAVFANITARKRAEEALRESEERLRLAVSAGSMGTWDRNFLSGRLNWSAECKAMFGLGPEIEMSDELFAQALHPEDRAATNLAVDEALEKHADFATEYRTVWPDGTIHWIAAQGRGYYNEEGQVVHMAGVTFDITERKRAEEALSESEERYRTVVSNMPVVTFVTDEKGIFTLSEGRGLANLGLQPGQVVGLSVFDMYRDYPTIVRSLQNALAGYSQRDEVEVQGVVFDMFYTPIFDQYGKVVKVIGVSNDVTERKRAEDEIRQLNAELEQRVRERTAQLETTNKELEAFSYSVSHDLRAPLRGIDGWSHALLEDYHDQLDEQGRQYIDRVRSETQRMGYLIDDMLKLSRLTRAEMVKEQVDLSAIVQAVVERLKHNEPHRHVEFNIQAGLTARGDAHLLEAVLTNLLGNAFKFTSKRAEARIEFGQTELEDQRVFFVRDNGAGFDMTYSQKLFGAFQRMHKASEFPGTGIGLATVQRVVHRHGGRVWAEAEVERGATFYFTLE